MDFSNNGTIKDSEEWAKSFVVGNENVKSALCSGIQWDMVMSTVNGKDGYNVEEMNEERHLGEKRKTGQNPKDKVYNIYDLEGNAAEYVAEKISSFSAQYSLRGGNWRTEKFPASKRSRATEGMSLDTDSFRCVLYVK